MFIPDPDLDFLPFPDTMVNKTLDPGYLIPNPDPQIGQ
jgi:hypothetical protein